MSKQLRKLLQEMTADLDIGTYPQRLKEISLVTPHTIAEVPTPGGEPLNNFNCVMYALGIVGRLDQTSTEVFGRWYADTGFMRHLIDQGVLKQCDVRIGAIVTWSSTKGLRHAGLLIAPGRVRSKWSCGYLYEHGFDEVPESYGKKLDFYAAPDPEIVLRQLGTYLGQI